MPSVSSSRWVYWAGPGRSCARSLVSARCSRSNASGPSTRTVPRWLTSNATARRATRTVFGERAVGVGQRHVPAAEGDELGAERAVDGVERRVPEGRNRHPWVAGDSGPAPLPASLSEGSQLTDRGVDLRLAPIPSARTLSTPWPCWTRSMSSPSSARAPRSTPEMTRLAAGQVVAQASAQVVEHVADRLEADAGVEQLLDDLELEQVAVGVHPPGAAALRIGQCRAHEVGAGPVVELPVA